MEQFKQAPEYVVKHDSIGGVFSKGDVIPHGTYDDEQLARLVGLGAIEPVDELPEPDRDATGDVPVADVSMSAEEFKEWQDAAALAAAGGADGSLDGADLTDAQRAALADAGYRTAADVRAASDADLRKVDGIGDATVKRLREATGA